MADLVGHLGTEPRLRGRRDERFLAWRYRNPLVEYRFVYAGDDRLDGYLVLASHRSAASDGPVHIVDLEATSDGVRGRLLAAVVGFELPSLVAWPRPGSDDDGRLESLGFVIDRPTGRPTADIHKPTVLVRQLGDDSTIGQAIVTEAADWDPRMIYFDEV